MSLAAYVFALLAFLAALSACTRIEQYALLDPRCHREYRTFLDVSVLICDPSPSFPEEAAP